MRINPKENDKEERDADDQLDHRDNQKFADHMKVGQSVGCGGLPLQLSKHCLPNSSCVRTMVYRGRLKGFGQVA